MAGTPARAGRQLGLFNVKDYGATGNGTTSDTAAIQAAHNAAIQSMSGSGRLNGGATVWFPAGIYLIDGTGISWGSVATSYNSGVTWQGTNGFNGAQLLLKTGATGPIVTITDASISYGWTINDLIFSAQTARSTGQYGVSLGNTAWGTINRCMFDSLDRGINSVGALAYQVNDCDFRGPNYGMYITNGARGANSIHVRGGRMLSCQAYAVYYVGGNMLNLSNIQIESNAGGVYLHSNYSSDGDGLVNIRDCWFEAQTTNKAITLNTSAPMTLIEGCQFIEDTNNYIVNSSTSPLVIRNNNFDGAGSSVPYLVNNASTGQVRLTQNRIGTNRTLTNSGSNLTSTDNF